jgi:hypothetical protein
MRAGVRTRVRASCTRYPRCLPAVVELRQHTRLLFVPFLSLSFHGSWAQAPLPKFNTYLLGHDPKAQRANTKHLASPPPAPSTRRNMIIEGTLRACLPSNQACTPQPNVLQMLSSNCTPRVVATLAEVYYETSERRCTHQGAVPRP